MNTAEEQRLKEAAERRQNWQRWGTYLPERQWGTVREDYSADGNAWTSFTHEMARYRAYCWGEDGLLGWTDRECRLCYSTSLWNGKDPILKERLFGLTNGEGNHGEDVKEQYYYLDALPTGAYAKALYKYPQRAFPYHDLVRTNQERGFGDSEYELIDTGVFEEERYFDMQVEYAKNGVEDTLIRLTITNRGPEAAEVTVLPTLTLRNNWSWRTLEQGQETRPWMHLQGGSDRVVVANHATLGRYQFLAVGTEDGPRAEQVIFTENDTNVHRLDPTFADERAYTKDAFDRFIVQGEEGAINPKHEGTKVASVYRLQIAAGAQQIVRLRLVRDDEEEPSSLDVKAFEQCFDNRQQEADEFYADRIPQAVQGDARNVARQAYAGLLWTKQFYYYVAQRWLEGDPAQPAPPSERLNSPNSDWRHLFCRDILSVPDKWEYPWFASWDTAFHMIPMGEIDPGYAKTQLLILLREWYLHPNGQMPAYEFKFSDVNPPVHAWSADHVYQTDAKHTGVKDTDFLERCFQKLLMNFTWWVNRNDANGRNLFGGGFLGLDNIGVFDRSKTLPDGVCLNQADGTAWMGMFCSSMLTIAIELAQTRPVYEDIATKFFEHFTAIIDALNTMGGTGLWDDEEGFYFDQLEVAGSEPKTLKVRSIVGIIPLYAVAILRKADLERLPEFRKRMEWFFKVVPQLGQHVAKTETDDQNILDSDFIALVPKDRLKRILEHVLDEAEFFSGHGIRSVSRYHEEHPFEIELAGEKLSVKYTPAESDSNLFGGNSNWRGPVWFPVNALLVNALQRYHTVYGDAFTMECPTGSGRPMNLLQISEDLAGRLAALFLRDETGRRPCHGNESRYVSDPHWRDLPLFNEYFSGDTGRGIGASHQTGWTALAATFLTNMRGGENDTSPNRVG